MRTSRRIPRWPLKLLVLAGAAAALGACGGGDKKDVAVLSASPAKPSFQRNEPVSLNLTLNNPSDAPITVSTSARGTLQVVSLERDGRPVAPRRSFLQTYESLAVVVRARLRSVPVGKSIGLSFTSTFNQGAGGQAFYSVRIARLQNPLQVYSVAAPGRYVLKLQYRYPSEAQPSGSTYTGPSNVATASFDVAS